MQKKCLAQGLFFAISLYLILSDESVFANNLIVTNVSLQNRDPAANTVVVNFNASWENSWRNKINHDALWLTVRLYDPAANPSAKNLCTLTASGVNPAGTSSGSSTGLEVYVPSDKTGAFLRRSTYAATSSVTSSNIQLKIDYGACGFADNSQVNAEVFGMEMVYIPQGAFYAGDYNTGTASLNQGSADSDPWYINSESAIPVTNPVSNGFRYVSNNNSGESATGSSFTIPASFPKGYQPFYCMKHEITEGQWVAFINSLPSAAARANRDLTNGSHKNSDSVSYRNTISCSGSPLSCSTTRKDRPVSFMSWTDLSAFLDWAALRPMTELEYEKISRGPGIPFKGEYSWGTTNLTAAAAISGAEDGTELVSTASANANYNNTTFTGGDAGQGPLRAGIFATNSSSRENAGGSYYGVLDLSGNLKERVVTIGNVTGQNFTGSHGNGALTTTASYEGNADVSGWVATDADPSRGVTGATGSGFKGGSWEDINLRLRISDRSDAANPLADAQRTYGGRGVRTYDGP